MEGSSENGNDNQNSSIQKNSYLRDYRNYRYSAKNKLLFLGLSVILSAAIGYLFYDAVWLTVMTVPVYGFILHVKRGTYAAEEKLMLCGQFKDGILAVSASLQAGYSIENSFREASAEMERLYGHGSLIYREFSYINGRMAMNVTLEELLQDFADRSGCEDIETFCQVFIFAKRSGGSLAKVIASSAASIARKIETANDIRTDLASRRYESLVMSVMPLFIIGYVRLSTPSYFDCLYHNLTGVLVMTGCLAVYGASFLLSEKLLRVGGIG